MEGDGSRLDAEDVRHAIELLAVEKESIRLLLVDARCGEDSAQQERVYGSFPAVV